MRASKDGEGHATHVLSAFCTGLQSVLGTEASRGRGMEIPDALKLLERLDLKGKIVTGDAMFCQKSIVAKIVEKGGDYIFPVKDNQKNLRENIQTAFNEPVFPLISFRSGHDKAHGRIERRLIDVLTRQSRWHPGRLAERKTHLPRHAFAASQEAWRLETVRSRSRLSDRQPASRRRRARGAPARQQGPLGY